MASTTTNLEALVYSLVPHARTDEPLKKELVDHCQEILQSHFGQVRDQDIGHLADVARRKLLQISPGGATSLRFTNLLSRLLDQPVLSQKYGALLFLNSLAGSPHPAKGPTFLPSLAPPPPQPRASAAPSPVTTNAPLHRSSKGKSKAELLREYRASRGRPHLSEHLLLRDTLYLLQGISGKHVLFSNAANEEQGSTLAFVEDPRNTIPDPTRALIHRLAEVGHLYARVDAFVRTRENSPGVGMIEQSLCHHLQTQLTEYYRLIAVLESQMSMASSGKQTDAESAGVDAADDIRDEERGLTLRRLDVWITEWRLRMRMMSVCVEGARDAHGGALVNLIHSYTDNGDPFVRRFTDSLLEDVSRPFFAALHKWLFAGELYDPFSEFFVAVDPALAHVQYVHPSSLAGGFGHLSADDGFGGLGPDNEDVSGEREGGLRLWENKYQFRKDMLPAFVGEAFGKKIFSTGKSLNFIRYSCHDSDWVATRDKLGSTGDTLKYSDIAGLERSIDAAYQIASQRLFDVFFDKFKLLDHLRALKHYLMLGYGDFADQLMDALGPSLAKPANTLYRHNLTATLETAIRTSNAQSDPADVLRRLDVRMLEYSHGEIGWDVFTLEYKIDAPIDAVVDPDAMVKYLKLFNHLWKIKRVESTLSQMWMRTVSGTRSFLRVPELEHEWHQVRIVMAEMIHFIRQTQAYCQLEVIECSWKTLLEFVHKKEGGLDELIDAHRKYLDRMVKKVLLLGHKAGKEEHILNQVREVFVIILQFREATDDLYNYCLSESARRDKELDAARGLYTGATWEGESEAFAEALRGILDRVKEYGSLFSEHAQAIVHGLQGHADLDCRFLGIRLSFSDFYRTKKDAHHAHAKS